MIDVLHGDCRRLLPMLPAASVHCIITSPPYFGLRDYGHLDQIGVEPTPAAYVARLVEVMRECRRVLRDDGTLWLVIDDSYSRVGGLKAKNLIGIPWRVAFALQDDGWYLRQDIVWSKSTCMPESAKDRCTRSHEYVFLLSKRPRYYFDQEAIRTPHAETNRPQSEKRRLQRMGREVASVDGVGQSSKGIDDGWVAPTHVMRTNPAGANKRSVWTVATQPFKGAHFAVFPEKLIEPCILAGCPPGGIVLDPFAGAGTIGVVAERLGRRAVLIELTPGYVAIIRQRIAKQRMFAAHEGRVLSLQRVRLLLQRAVMR
jgi:DNA modification methylase